MSRRDDPAEPARCKHITRRHGDEIECNDVGTWVRDNEARTWRPARPSDKKRRCWLHGPGSDTRAVGGNRKNIQPNAQLQRYAALVLGLALEASKAQHDIADELSLLGFPSTSRGGTTTGDDDGPVARDAVRIHELTAWREDLRDWINDLGPRIDVGVHIIKQIRRLPPAAMGAKLCAENQQGRQGSIEWGDATCTELPTKNGLCVACYHRERRWRVERDLPTSEAPAA